jgi:hypothetical protein
MLIFSLFAATAFGGDVITVFVNTPSARDLTDYNDVDEDEEEDEDEEQDEEEHYAPRSEIVSQHGSSELQFRYATHLLPEAPAHFIGLRHVGEKDAYLTGELRYMPGSDLLWTGRAGAGFDLFGRGDWDLTFGLFIGSSGEWDHQASSRILYMAPMGGTEIGLGYDGDRLFAKYRWLAGLGGGPLDDLLTENELTVGYKITRPVHVFGQWIRVNPGEAEKQGGIGLGVQAVF